MKVYYVTHFYDNGESYEDYRSYQDTYLFSSFKKANSTFWDYVTSDYEGKYVLGEWELDTQNMKELETSVYLPCRPHWSYEDEPYYPDYYDPDLCIEDSGENMEYLVYEDEVEEPSQEEEEWLTHKGENYKIFKEIEDDRLLKLLNQLNDLLDERHENLCSKQ